MGEFLVRTVSCIAIVGCLIGYNQVVEQRKQQEEIVKQQMEEDAKKEQLENAQAADAEMVSCYTDGTYTGEAQGFGGIIEVQVEIVEDQIKEITVLSAKQEDGAYLAMVEDIIPKILEAQDAQVDTISGATFSSTGIKDAVAQALEKAEK